MKPELLNTIPNPTENGTSHHDQKNGDSTPKPQEPDQSSDESTQDSTNGKHPAPVSTDVIDDTTTSFTEDSLDKPSTPTVVPPGDENTNDSIATSDSATNDSTAIATAIITCNNKSDEASTKRETEEDTTSSLEEPPTKKTKVDGEK